MPYYIDPESGSNTNGGTSISVLLTATDGVTNGTTTFTSATGGFTGKAGHGIYIASGKNVWRKIVSVNSDTSIVLSAAVAAGSGLTYTVGGAFQDTSNISSLNTVADEVRIKKSPDIQTFGTCTWTQYSGVVTVPSGAFKNVCDCDLPWTPSANVITTVTSFNKKAGRVNRKAIDFEPAAAFGTGTQAYIPLYTWFDGGSASASSTYSSYTASCAFDRTLVNNTNYFWRNNNSLPAWLEYDLGSGNEKTITSYLIFFGATANNRPKDFKVQGSNNHTDWTDVDTRTGEAVAVNTVQLYTCNGTTGSYRYYRIYITAVQSGSYCEIGKWAYIDSNTALDLSSYTHLSFWLKKNTALSAGALQIDLCSDLAATTVVDTIVIPEPVTTAQWIANRVARTGGGYLGSSIKSIRLYSNSDPGVAICYLDNIVAVLDGTADGSLSHKTILGLGSTEAAGYPWFTFTYLDGTSAYLEGWVGTDGGTNDEGGKYPFSTTTATTYKRESLSTYTTTTIISLTSQADGGYAIVKGGWNFSSDEQDGYSYLLFQFIGSATNLGKYCCASRIGTVRTYIAHACLGNGYNGNYTYLDDMGDCVSCRAYGHSLYNSASGMQLTANLRNISTIGASYAFYSQTKYGKETITIKKIICFAALNTALDIEFNSQPIDFTVEGIYYHDGTGTSHYPIGISNIQAGGIVRIGDCIGWTSLFNSLSTCNNLDIIFSGEQNPSANRATVIVASTFVVNCRIYNLNLTGGYTHTKFIDAYDVKFINCDFNTTTITGGLVSLSGYPIYNVYFINPTYSGTIFVPGSYSGRGKENGIYIEKLNGDATDNRFYTTNASYYQSQTTTRHTSSGLAWAMYPKDATFINEYAPLRLKLAKLYLTSGTTYAISVYMRRSDTGMSMKLCVDARDIATIDSTLSTASITAEADQWQQVTVNYTAANTGVHDVYVDAWGGNSYVGYVDDMSVA